MFHQNWSKFRFWPPVKMWNEALISYNSKTKHWRCMNLYIFEILVMRQTIWTLLSEKSACFNFWPTWKLQGQWQPSWKYNDMWHIWKMLLMLCLACTLNQILCLPAPVTQVLWNLLYFWCKHQMHLTMFHSNTKNAKSRVSLSQYLC